MSGRVPSASRSDESRYNDRAQSFPALSTRRCFPYEDRRVIWAPTLAPKVGAFSFVRRTVIATRLLTK